MTSEEIREAFHKEFTSIQDSRSQIHKDFVDHGLRFMQQRREFIKTLFLVSIGFVLTPKILDVPHDSLFYYISLGSFVGLAIISILYLKEYTDYDEAGVVELRNKSLVVINKRLGFAGDYIQKNEITAADVEEYYKQWQSIPELVELDQLTERTEKDLKGIEGRRVDPSTSFFMFLFVLGVFFLMLSIFYADAPVSFIVVAVILIVFFTMNNLGMKIINLYSRLIHFFPK